MYIIHYAYEVIPLEAAQFILEPLGQNRERVPVNLGEWIDLTESEVKLVTTHLSSRHVSQRVLVESSSSRPRTRPTPPPRPKRYSFTPSSTTQTNPSQSNPATPRSSSISSPTTSSPPLSGSISCSEHSHPSSLPTPPSTRSP